jgi:hypothetical protein
MAMIMQLRWILPASVAAGGLLLWVWKLHKKVTRNLPPYGGTSLYSHMSTLLSGDGERVLSYMLQLARSHGPIYRERYDFSLTASFASIAQPFKSAGAQKCDSFM